MTFNPEEIMKEIRVLQKEAYTPGRASRLSDLWDKYYLSHPGHRTAILRAKGPEHIKQMEERLKTI